MQLTEVSQNNKNYTIIDPTLKTTIKLNIGEFLYAINENNLTSCLVKNYKADAKKPPLVEFAFIEYLRQKIQQKINSSEITPNQVGEVISKVNEHIHTQCDLLTHISELDNKDEFVKNNIRNLYGYFEDTIGNVISLPKKIVEEIKEEPVVVKPTFPPYDEVTVTTVLSSKLGSNFDINQFINQYYENLNLEQINLLLTNFNLNENQINLLNEKKQKLDVITDNSNSKASLGKRKTFALPGVKENKESAFIDTLLLSFTVGIFCGIYLMYFVLTIMS